MTVGLLIITHNRIGDELLGAATAVLGMCPLVAETYACSADCDPERALRDAKSRIAALDRGAGVLVLTDLYGSTPGNIATHLCKAERVMVVSGVNLSMLVRVLNYSYLGLEELAEKAVSGGKAGVILCRDRGDCTMLVHAKQEAG